MGTTFESPTSSQTLPSFSLLFTLSLQPNKNVREVIKQHITINEWLTFFFIIIFRGKRTVLLSVLCLYTYCTHFIFLFDVVISSKQNERWWLTPSFVQVQLVHGDIFLEEPRVMSSPLTRHCVTSSLQWVTSISGKARHGTRGFLSKEKWQL